MTKLDTLISSRPPLAGVVPALPQKPAHPVNLLTGKALVGIASPCAQGNVRSYRMARGLPIA